MPRSSLPLVALALVLAPAFLPNRASADEAFDRLQKEFPERVAERVNSGEREMLVTQVAAYDDPEGARLLVQGLAALMERYGKDQEAFEKLRKLYAEVDSPLDLAKDDFKTKTELQDRIFKAERNQQEDGRVFHAFRTAFGKLQNARAVSTFASLLRKEKSWRVKEIAAEGLGANAAGLEAALSLAKEKDVRVQAALLRGLRGRRDDKVFELALKLIKDENWPVRYEAAALLESINEPRVVKPLIEALGREEGRLRDDLRDILRRLTSQNFDADFIEWKRWYEENVTDFEGEGPKSALFGSFKAKPDTGEKKGVYGIETRSRRILFIIDTSGSMKDPLIDKAGEGGTPTGLSLDELEERNSSKIEIAKRELKRAIRGLEPDAVFNIIAFATHVIRWKPEMVKADMSVKNEAYLFVREMQAMGGTWSYGALQEAFRIGGMGVTDKAYDPTIDTIYFISDGAPTDNDMDKPQFMDHQIILDAVREWNRLGKVAIHAVAVDTKAAGGRFIEFMKKLAAENGGQYTQRD